VRFRFDDRSVIVCSNCGLLSYHPLPTGDDLREIYENESYFEHGYFAVDDKESQTVHYSHFLKVANLAKAHLKRNEKLLEIGPGRGLFLQLCLERGLKAEGLEFSSLAARDLTERLGCPVHHGILEELEVEPENYAMVVAFDVMEHCTDPMTWLKAINSTLKPDGLLAISTVSVKNFLDAFGHMFYKLNVKGPVKRLYPPYHLYYFNPETLINYLETAGFSAVEIIQENYDYRKATSNALLRLALRAVYGWHNLTGNKTNLYIIAKKI
jgi:cyclopropane fatty-acyl-phospholipid synthase-like methyltransferase